MVYEITPNDSITESAKKLASGDVLYLKNGIYNEKVEIFNDNISIIGEDMHNTIIQNMDYYHKILADHNVCNTFRSYTMYLGGANITLKNLTIKNLSKPSSLYGQALALYNDSDNFLAENVILDGAQDTLFTGPLPYFLRERQKNFLRPVFLRDYVAKQIYKNCIIKGDTDFIFGNATALFVDCDIISIKSNSPRTVDGYVCAPSHAIDQEFGYLFYHCNIDREDGVKNVFLARPWGKYGKCAFIYCQLGDHINPEGYSVWPSKNRHLTSVYQEYGAYDTSNRVPWIHVLTKEEKNAFVKAYFKNINYIEKE